MTGLLLLAALWACGDETDTLDTDPGDTESAEPCEELVVDVMGDDPPHVGDTWTVWLRCDGATLTGATVLRFDPPDFATIDDNQAAFLYVGEATMTIQVGRERVTREVEVVE